ncbi:MAG TPA: alcohol dehydrogenase catalytic domain-containing protein [Gemmatimonadota bacterium]
MIALQYVRSVPRYLAARFVGSRFERLYTSGFSTVRLAEIDPPSLPGPRWARVRPILAGICGSDLATITAQGTTYFSPFVSTPFVFGHEVVGEVVETGADVRRVAVGDRVALSPPLHCAVRGIEEPCAECRAGHTGHCTNVTEGAVSAGIQTGYCRDTGGGWSRSLVAHELQLHAVPDGVSDEAAVLIEPLSCCMHAVARAAVPDDGTALVLGAGTIGALTIAALRASGARCRIVAVAKYRHQQETARRLGADVVIGSGGSMREDLARELGTELHETEIGPPTSLGGADVTFDCIASAGTLDDAMRFTRARGAVIVVGMPGVPDGVDWTAMWHKELDVRGSYTSDEETFGRAVATAARLDASLKPLVGARFPLEEWTEALDCALHASAKGVIKTVFAP